MPGYEAFTKEARVRKAKQKHRYLKTGAACNKRLKQQQQQQKPKIHVIYLNYTIGCYFGDLSNYFDFVLKSFIEYTGLGPTIPISFFSLYLESKQRNNKGTIIDKNCNFTKFTFRYRSGQTVSGDKKILPHTVKIIKSQSAIS